MMKWFGILGLSVLSAALVWLFGLVWFNTRINAYEADTTTHTDAIVVLTGGRNRIAEAVNLLNDGLADKLFISGVPRDVSLRDISKREDVHIATTREIALDKKSTNTIENATEACAWIADNNIKSIRLVTSNYHIPRAWEEFNALNHDILIIPHAVYSDKVTSNVFSNWGTFALIASEYNKFLYAYLKHLF